MGRGKTCGYRYVFVFTVAFRSVVQPMFQSDLWASRGLRGVLAPFITGTILLRAYISPS